MDNQIELAPTTLAFQNPVVVIQNACKSYGSKKNSLCVLNDFNMTVPKGVIYALLGSSGCGKTTLLNCLIGQKRLDKGKIWVLGGPPNSKESKVPGPSIGYMPQTVGVQSEFTTRETMQFFGEIAGMPKKRIDEKIIFLQQLLMLPNLDVVLGNLSGGEKRRVSFAIALIHEPELLILDEPTVGLDPLLRESIWSYLYKITLEQQVTVILTTHYIDEARNASIVSLLRGGTLLAEESPDSLLPRLGVVTLEEAFSKLSTLQSNNEGGIPPIYVSQLIENSFESSQKPYKPNQISALKPLLRKNYKWLIKNPMVVVLAVIIPAFQIFLFNAAIGHDPININLAVVNEETTVKNCSPISCDSVQLSCNFLQYLEKSDIILNYYDSEYNAIQSVQHGKTYASVFLRHNYSEALKERFNFKVFQDWDLLYASIDVYRDISNYNVALYIKSKLLQSFDSFINDYVRSCRHRNVMSIPMKFNDPVYGKKLPDFAQFAIPALILSSICFFSAWSTASALLTEFSSGVTERTLVLGVNPSILLLTHAISELVIMIIHIIAVFVSVFAILKFPLEGSEVVLTFLLLLQGFCGLSFGFLLYSTCPSDAVATYVLLGSFFPASVLSGIVWPLEGMPTFMREIGFYLPFTAASEAMRSIMQRGWGITYFPIYSGFAIIIAWTTISLAISIYSIKYNKK